MIYTLAGQTSQSGIPPLKCLDTPHHSVYAPLDIITALLFRCRCISTCSQRCIIICTKYLLMTAKYWLPDQYHGLELNRHYSLHL